MSLAGRHSPLQLVIGRCVFVSDVGQVAQDLSAVDGQTGQQDELLPGGTQQACVVFNGQLAEERQLLDPGDLPEEQLISQTTQQSKALTLSIPTLKSSRFCSS